MADLKLFAQDIGEEAEKEIQTLASLPAFSDSKIRIMPDVHAGKGCVIGFTADLKDKVIPNVVGVDIGCGMLMTKIEAVDIDFAKLDETIRRFIPSGTRIRDQALSSIDYSRFLLPLSSSEKNHFNQSLGTLGGGNHFLEIDRGEDGSFYLLIHTGSRSLGTRIADFYQKKAIAYHTYEKLWEEEKKQVIQERTKEGKTEQIPEDLKRLEEKYKGKTDLPKELCFLEGGAREEYLNDMRIAQYFAEKNRALIRDVLFDRMGWKKGESFECVHNYIGEDNIIRKGAVSAYSGEPLIIPLNMKDGVILAHGKGNEDWNNSAPHGAGRRLSRTKAREELTLDEFQKVMNGIYSTSISNATLDEAPLAYKDPEAILKYLPQTAEIDRILKPVYNFKAG